MANVAVIGAGTMGAGIAQVCATAGHNVMLFDLDDSTLAKAFDATRSSLAKFVAKGRITSDEADRALERIVAADSVTAAASDTDLVIEAVVERLDVKQAIFREAAAAARDDTIFGTNTSQLSVTAVGSALGSGSDRVVGTHFFNPPVLMPLVELVAGLDTSRKTLEWAEDFARGLGKETVICRKDSPGFLTSRISAIVRIECLRMLEEELASPADIDKALKLGLNFPMGPLELGDFNGLDTYLHALEGLERAFGDRYRPTTTLKNLVAAGRLGRKSGQGIYRYGPDGQRLDEPGGRGVSQPTLASGRDTISVDVHDGVAYVELRRPEAANPRNQRMREELQAAWSSIAADTGIGVVVLTGEGDRFFCAGMDLREASDPESAVERRDRLRGSRDIEQLASLPQPTIAAINGYALGGGLEMALACDLRIAADTAQVGLTEIVHGLVPGGGGTQRLPRLIGHARAAEMILTGMKLDANTAASWGLVNRVVPAADLPGAAEELATSIAVHSGRALRYAKELLRQSADVPISVGAQLELDSLLTLMAN